MLSYLPRWGASALVTVALTCVALVSAGCEGPVVLTPPDVGPADAGPPAEMRTLSLVGDDSLALVFDESTSITVALTGPTGAPVEGAAVGFAIEGEATDSSLATLSDTTDDAGLAHGILLAGHSPATFRVRASAEGATPVSVAVAVSGHGFGAIDVRIDYAGERRLDRLEAAVYVGSSCASARDGDAVASVTRSLAPDSDGARFDSLPALERYALVVDGVASGGVTLASACVEDVLVTDGESTSVSASLEDLPLRPGGEYDMVWQLSAPLLSAEVAETVRAAGEAAVADRGGDVSMFLDALDARLTASGDLAGVAVLAGERAATGLEADLDARLMVDGAGPSAAVDTLSTALTDDLEQIELQGLLSFGPDSGVGFMASGVSAGSPGSSLTLLDLTPFGVHTRTELTAHRIPGQDAAQLEALWVELPAGVLVRARVRATARAAGVDDASAWLLSHLGCDSFADFLATDAALSLSCDASCVADVCATVATELWSDLGPSLEALDLARSGVALSGRLDFVDDDADLRVDRVRSSTLSAETTGEAASPLTLEASAEASRTAYLP